MSNFLVDTFLIIEHARNGNGALLRDLLSIMLAPNLGLAGADLKSHVQNKMVVEQEREHTNTTKQDVCLHLCLFVSVCVCLYAYSHVNFRKRYAH